MSKYKDTLNKTEKYKHYVYKMIFPDGAYYIGCSHQLAVRMHQHEKKRGDSIVLYNKLDEFGEYELKIISVHENRSEAREHEKKLINKCVHDIHLLNRKARYINSYMIIKSHKERGYNYDKERLNKLKQKIGFL